MKFSLYCAAAMLIFLGGVNYGLREGMKRERFKTEQYRTLYNQAIMWQELELEDLPHKAPNVKLKEKEE